VSRFHAQPNKAASVRAKRTALERIEKDQIELPPDPRESIAISNSRRRDRAATASCRWSISIRLTEISRFTGLRLRDHQGEKAVLVGENGAGKSTLLKIMAGVVAIDGGTRTVGHNVDMGIFADQARCS
jgi:ATP-binding cassette subfamily F protein 3